MCSISVNYNTVLIGQKKQETEFFDQSQTMLRKKKHHQVSVPVNLAGILAPGLPGPVPTSVIMTAPVTSCLQPTVPIDAMGPPPPLGQPCQTSPMYSQVKPVPPLDNDEV